MVSRFTKRALQPPAYLIGFALAMLCAQVAHATDATWVKLATAHSPTGRNSACAAYDALNKQMVVFGGIVSSRDTNDVWVLSLGCTPDWTQLSPSGTLPATREHASAVFDPADSCFIVYAGVHKPNTFGNGDLWSLYLGGGTPSWTRLNDGVLCPNSPVNGVPCGRQGHAAVWAPGAGMLMFGGLACFARQDSWLANPTRSSVSWTGMAGSIQDCPTEEYTESLPDARDGHTLVWDTHSGQAVVAGGQYFGDANSDEMNTWIGDGNSWDEITALTQDGSPRSGHVAVYDTKRHRMIVHGGANDSLVVSADFSSGNPTRWDTLSVTGKSPGVGKSDHVAIYDPDGDRMVLLVGGDTYALNFDTTGPSTTNSLSSVIHSQHLYLRWTAAGESLSTGQALCYDMRWSTSSINDSNFNSANALGGVPSPSTGGSKDSVEVTGFADGNTYYFALKTKDHHGNISALSNVYSICITMNPWTLCGGEQIAQRDPENQAPSSPLPFGINRIFPNPAQGKMSVDFTLARAGAARLEVLDVSGRRLRDVELGSLAPGQHQVDLGGKDPLPPGFVLIRLTQGDATISRSAMLLR
jgi:hypothetical protein